MTTEHEVSPEWVDAQHHALEIAPTTPAPVEVKASSFDVSTLVALLVKICATAAFVIPMLKLVEKLIFWKASKWKPKIDNFLQSVTDVCDAVSPVTPAVVKDDAKSA